MTATDTRRSGAAEPVAVRSAFTELSTWNAKELYRDRKGSFAILFMFSFFFLLIIGLNFVVNYGNRPDPVIAVSGEQSAVDDVMSSLERAGIPASTASDASPDTDAVVVVDDDRALITLSSDDPPRWIALSSAVADTAAAFTLVVEHFARTGRRRLVYVGGPGGSWQDAQRTAAVRAAAARVGASLEVVGPYPPTFAAGAEAARRVRELRPDAVIPYATALGLGIQHVSLVAGETPPAVSSERASVEALGLTDVPAIDVAGRVLGDVAARLLSQRIQDPAGDPNRVRLSVPVTWGA